MPQITICPRCTSHLGLPADVSRAAQVQCPICEVEFSLAAVSPRELPQARIIESEAATVAEPAAEAAAQNAGALSAQERLSQLLRSTAQWRPTPADDGEQTQDDAYHDADPELAAERRDDLLEDLKKLTAATSPEAVNSSDLSAPADEPAPSSFESLLARDFAAGLDEPSESGEADGAEDHAVPSFGEATEDELPQDLQTAPRRKRRPAGMRLLVGVVGGGAIGLLLGAYGLLWLKGADADVLGLAKWLPAAALPPSIRQMADDDAAARDGAANDETEMASTESQIAEAPQSPLRFDPAVAPATAEEPVTKGVSDNEARDVLPLIPETPAPTLAAPPIASSAAWPASVMSSLRKVKLYSIDEMDELLAAADAASREFLAGDLSREQSWSTMGPAYMTLASLAERYTLLDAAAEDENLTEKKAAAEETLRSLTADPARRSDLATVAARWLQHERRLNQGVILVGRVRDMRPQGSSTEYVIDVPLGESSIAAKVLLNKPSFAVGDEIAIVGAILPRPQEQLAGYEGDAAQLVLARAAFAPVDNPSTQPAEAAP